MLKNYIVLALKVLRRRKFFTFISLFAISFTLAILILVTSLLDHTFGPMPPETHLDRTLGVYMIQLSGPERRATSEPGYGFLDRVVRPLSNVERVSIYSTAQAITTYREGDKQNIWVKRTDGAYWKILNFTFVDGQPFSEQDDRDGNRVAVINQSTAEKFFGSEPAVGKTVTLEGQSFQVVGVVEDVPFLRLTPFADVWVPIGTFQDNTYKTQLMGGFHALILAKASDDFPMIKAEFASRLKQFPLPDPRMYDRMVAAPETYFESLSREILSSSAEESHPNMLLGIIVFIMVLFMLLPTVNLININVSRILERASEIGVRKAFGAPATSLIGQFVVENLFLTLIGGLIGFIVALIGLQILTLSGLIPYAEFHVNYRIVLYGLALAVFFGLFSGVYPAWRMSRMQPVEALKGRLQ